MQTLSPHDLARLGSLNIAPTRANLTAASLYEEAIRRGEAQIAASGPLVVNTGQFTGRSPNDKFIVRDHETEDSVDWGAVNRPLDPTHFATLRRRMAHYAGQRDLFTQDLYVGADPNYRLSVRVVSESAWASLFSRNLFIRPTAEELADFRPDFTVLNLPGFKADPKRDGSSSETIIALNMDERLVLIGGTGYAGEIKKAMFTVMNYLLPAMGVLPMHCAANVGTDGDVALFFGLSGTGKTTLSADPNRVLIGDDEHGWSGSGVFNFEGGCYAKVIELSPSAEPAIWAASNRFGTVLENVVMDDATHSIRFEDGTRTENTRAAYPLYFIPNTSPTGMGGHPRNIVMLSADAFGVLPPVAHLDRRQAIYYFLSGYTAKLAGTERGITAPQAEFSACFGAPFLPLPATTYAAMLGELAVQHDADIWLVNTGWTGGPYGTGQRMSIAHTRAIINAALDGSLARIETRPHPIFGLQVPVTCPGVPDGLLDARSTWADKEAYDSTARDLVERFRDNFARFAGSVGEDICGVL